MTQRSAVNGSASVGPLLGLISDLMDIEADIEIIDIICQMCIDWLMDC